MKDLDLIDKFFIGTLIWGMLTITLLIILAFITVAKVNRFDVNRDGIVNAQDYIEVKNYIMEVDRGE